jgi:hypothetical protein
MAAQHHILVAAGGVKATYPLYITFDAGAGLGDGMARQVQGF